MHLIKNLKLMKKKIKNKLYEYFQRFQVLDNTIAHDVFIFFLLFCSFL